MAIEVGFGAERRIGKFEQQLDIKMVGVSKVDIGGINGDCSKFVTSCSDYIIDKAFAGAGSINKAELKDTMAALSPTVAAELLLAIRSSANPQALVSNLFINSIQKFDAEVASALLYEIRFTGNVAALTDSRLFGKDAVAFFNALGQEAASEWFSSIGKTGRVEDLTSPSIINSVVLGMIGKDAYFASELSYAIGLSGELGKIASPEVLASLSAVSHSVAIDYLSAMWSTGKIDDLTSASALNRLGSVSDVWAQVVRPMAQGNDGVKVIISKPAGEDHSRGALESFKLLADSGFNPIYIGNANGAADILNIALSENVAAIGFSIGSKTHRYLVESTAAALKSNGINASLFGGGYITPRLAGSLEKSGMTIFSQNTTQTEMLGFFNISAMNVKNQNFAFDMLHVNRFVSQNVNGGMLGSSSSYSASGAYAHGTGGAGDAYYPQRNIIAPTSANSFGLPEDFSPNQNNFGINRSNNANSALFFVKSDSRNAEQVKFTFAKTVLNARTSIAASTFTSAPMVLASITETSQNVVKTPKLVTDAARNMLDANMALQQVNAERNQQLSGVVQEEPIGRIITDMPSKLVALSTELRSATRIVQPTLEPGLATQPRINSTAAALPAMQSGGSFNFPQIGVIDSKIDIAQVGIKIVSGNVTMKIASPVRSLLKMCIYCGRTG